MKKRFFIVAALFCLIALPKLAMAISASEFSFAPDSTNWTMGSTHDLQITYNGTDYATAASYLTSRAITIYLQLDANTVYGLRVVSQSISSFTGTLQVVAEAVTKSPGSPDMVPGNYVLAFGAINSNNQWDPFVPGPTIAISEAVASPSGGWSEPVGFTAPDCPTTGTNANSACFTPINTSSFAQTKGGALTVGGLTTASLKLPTNAGDGLFLKSDASGNATWGSVPAAGAGPWTISGTNIFNSNTGKVGIGSLTPETKLHVGSGDPAGSAILIESTAPSAAAFLMLRDKDTGLLGQGALYNWNGGMFMETSENGDIIFRDHKVSGSTVAKRNRMTVKANNVIIENGDRADGGIISALTLRVYNAAGNAYKDAGIFNYNGAMAVQPAAGYLLTLKDGSGTSRNALSVTPSGNIGIGTDGPSAKLHVVTTQSNDVVNGSGIKLSDVSNPNRSIQMRAGLSGVDLESRGVPLWINNGPCALTGDCQNILMVPVGGNVGIGTTNPTARLEVAGKAKVQSLQVGSSAVAGQVLTADASGNATWQAAGSGGGGSNLWTANGSSAYYNTGNVGVGVSSPQAKLDVNGNVHLGTGSTIYGEGDLYMRARSGGALRLGSNETNNQMVIRNGNVGIGTEYPSSRLQVIGDISAENIQPTDNYRAADGSSGESFNLNLPTDLYGGTCSLVIRSGLIVGHSGNCP